MKILSVGAAFLLFGAAAFAAQGEVKKPAKEATAVKACKNDIKKFCKDVKPGEGRLGGCLYAKLPKLSHTCKVFAGHAGKGNELESLKELDTILAPPSTP